MDALTTTLLVALSSFFITASAQEVTTLLPCEYKPECKYPAVLNKTTCSCDCTYEDHPDPKKFFVPIPNSLFKVPMSCAATLEWSQKQCDCVLPPDDVQVPVEDVFAKAIECTTLTDLRSDGVVFKNFDGYYMTTENSGTITLQPVPGASVDGKAARFEGTSLHLSVFRSNDLTSSALFKLRVNPDDVNQTNADNNQYILSDACKDHSNAAVELTYNPTGGNFTLHMRTSVTMEQTCEGVAPVDGWFDISISVANGEASWKINGSPCPVLLGTGNIDTTQCQLTVGGNPVAPDNSEDFYGYIDSVKVIKHCDVEPTDPVAA